MYSACLLALLTGFLSLSVEVLWVRLVSYSFHQAPQSFTFVIMFYLLGIAFGAWIGKRFCKMGADLWVVSGVALLLSCVCNLAGPWIYANVVFAVIDFPNHLWLVGGSIIVLTSLLTSIVFPIAHHLGTPKQTNRVGYAVSRVYVSNIAGATLGPILTGLILLAYVTTQQAFIICSLFTLVLAIYCLWHKLNKFIVSASMIAFSCQFALLVMIPPHALMHRVSITGYGEITNMVENQYGIATVYTGPFKILANNRVITGNNAYDGSENLDPVVNFNGINRVIIMSALVDHPARVLMIGLSIGSWLKMVTTFPNVENIDIIEINPGYLDIIKQFPAQFSALQDPRVHLYIDDGRRWLKAHPDVRYDMVVLNTTYHWRAYSANLLSQNFLKQIKHHMNPDAVLEYNSTMSPDAFFTATSVFKQVYLYRNFIIAADFDWRNKLLAPAAIDKLASLKMDGKLLFPKHSQEIITRYLHEPVLSLDQVIHRKQLQRRLEIITDNNMINEFKYGRAI